MLQKAWDGSGEPLRWFWLTHPEAHFIELIVTDVDVDEATEAFGLVVLWLQRGVTASGNLNL